MTEFFKEAVRLSNTYTNDLTLKNYLRKLPKDVLAKIEPHLTETGELAATKWLEWSQDAENTEPKLNGQEIIMPASWKNLEKAAATEGIVAAAYERKYAEWSRVYQMSLLYLFHSSSAFVSCPLAMTDGAARALELYGKKTGFKHLTSRDPKEFWTSGQWMTERTGGSDVSGTSTIAKKHKDHWLLSGTKWFTSATTSQMTMTLARPEGAEKGSKGLSLFYVETKNPDGSLKNIEILKLKNKLGTRAMPTAELELKNTPAELVGDLGGGVKKISAVLNITRIYNSICAISAMRRALDWAQGYSKVRTAFGKPLIDHPLHKNSLATLEKNFADCFKMTFFVVELLGKEETNQATEDEKILLRALTPVVKLYTGKKVTQITSEVCEMIGGAGYIEDTGIPTLVRDAQVFSIWEGTTNVLSLDFLRAIQKDESWPVLEEFFKSKKVELPEIPLFEESQARRLAFLVARALSKCLST
jgi:putative acyl-CoA dehydrogenase